MRASGVSRGAWLALVAAWATAPAAQPPPGRIESLGMFSSPGLVDHEVEAWLPPGYDEGGRRYGVLYMQDGQNLFSTQRGFGGQTWQVDEAIAHLAASGAIEPVIVVALHNSADRGREYLPARWFDALPPAQQALVEARQGRPLSDEYLRLLVEKVKPAVDARLRTLPDAAHTAVMGSSMGGLISLYALGEYPQVFGAAACLSTHWPLVMMRGREDLDLIDRPAQLAAAQAWLGARLPALAGHVLYMDRGDQTLDAAYPPWQAAMDAWLAAQPAASGLRWQSRAFPGARHDEASWRARLDVPLEALLAVPSSH